jgi:transposase-like protein
MRRNKPTKAISKTKGKVHPNDKFTPELSAKIINLVLTGESKANVCKLVGVSQSTINRWLTEQHDPRYLRFQEEYEFAEAQSARRLSLKIQQAATGYKRVQTVTTTSQVVKIEETRYDDGRVVKKPVVLDLTTTTVTESDEFDWRAAMEFLARRWPNEWSSRQKIEHSGEVKTPGVDLTKLSDEEIEDLERIIDRASKPGSDSGRKVSAELN